jgi:hypothetical protein
MNGTVVLLLCSKGALAQRECDVPFGSVSGEKQTLNSKQDCNIELINFSVKTESFQRECIHFPFKKA